MMLKKNAPNQADNISIFQLCLLLKMRLSVDLEGRYTGYKYALFNLDFTVLFVAILLEHNMNKCLLLTYFECIFYQIDEWK